MIQKIQNFFLELREKDEATKKRWLVILTSASMVVVIALWAVYLNFTLADLGPKPPASNEIGILKTSRAGLQIIAGKSIAYLQSLAQKTNSITIQSASINMILKDLEEIKPKRLP